MYFTEKSRKPECLVLKPRKYKFSVINHKILIMCYRLISFIKMANGFVGWYDCQIKA